MQAEAKIRRILLLVSGMSPQIITETLYALITQETPWVPDEVHLITTAQGRTNAVGQLLSEDNPRFEQLLNDYKITTAVKFSRDTIHVITQNGQSLEDLRTPNENEAAADFITEKIREFTQSKNTELHVSIAGGRKTMGFYAGYALSLFGRVNDKLSHVLVSDNYEGSDFYYPAPSPDKFFIKARDGKMLDTHNAKIWLAEIPFVKMRSELSEKLLTRTKSFSETIALANKANGPINLIIRPSARQIECNGEMVKIEKSLIPLLIWAAERHNNALPPIEVLVEGDKPQERIYADELLRIAEDYGIFLNQKTDQALKKGFSQKDLQEKVSRLSTQLSKTLGESLANRCKLSNRTTKHGKGYAFPEDIHVEIRRELI